LKTASIRFSFSILFCALLLTGCGGTEHARVEEPSGAYQVVNINTPGVTGVSCVLKSGRNTYSVTAPGGVTVARAPDRMDVSCMKGDHMQGSASVTPTFAPREAQQAQHGHGDCTTCTYPSTITVAMSLNGNAMDVKVTQFH